VTTKRLVINADDLGLAESVNRGIFETIDRGVVTSTSLMVNMPACDDAVTRLHEWMSRGERETLSIGLHFNIVTGHPLGVCPSLLDGGRGFLGLPSLALRAFARRLQERDVANELEAQLQRAKRLLEPLGLRVSHIDSHRHAHCLPPVFDVVVRAAKRHGIGHVRHPYEARALITRPHAKLASHVLRAMVASRRPIDDVGFAGVGAMGSRTFDRDIAQLIAALPAGTTELMVHPGYDSPELAAIDPYRAPRERELRVLTSPALRDQILATGVQLTPFATAPTASRATGRESEVS
jgi:predicted glycoside hydrolase/deacetylase ChbG (UPF0249 family)